MDYKSFLDLQLKLVQRIIATERRISKLKKQTPKDLQKIEEAIERRRLLKLLGTTVAWILLEFNRRYIRHFARGRDPGFISGKKGLKLEILALKTVFKLENCAGVLHDITNCLHVGDLSVKTPEKILTIECKLTKGKRKLDRRERRQKRKRGILEEFYNKGISTRLIPGKTTKQYISKEPEKHNWKEMSVVIGEAIEKGYGNRLVEECMIYITFQNRRAMFEKSIDEAIRLSQKVFKNPYLTFGCHDNHILGLPDIAPFTCFDIPFLYKEKLLFEEVGFCVLLDLNSLARIVQESGFHCKVLKSSRSWVLEFSHKVKGEIVSEKISYDPIRRLLYECLSVKTFLNYTKEMSEEVRKDKFWNEDYSGSML